MFKKIIITLNDYQGNYRLLDDGKIMRLSVVLFLKSQKAVSTDNDIQ